jgi:hypothetical protein
LNEKARKEFNTWLIDNIKAKDKAREDAKQKKEKDS